MIVIMNLCLIDSVWSSSRKFWRKLVYAKSLDALYEFVPLEKQAIPEKVKRYDDRHA